MKGENKMRKQKMYKYIGYNGTVTTHVLLDGVNHQVVYELKADDGKYLTNGKRKMRVVIADEDSINNWIEIEGIIE